MENLIHLTDEELQNLHSHLLKLFNAIADDADDIFIEAKIEYAEELKKVEDEIYVRESQKKESIKQSIASLYLDRIENTAKEDKQTFFAKNGLKLLIAFVAIDVILSIVQLYITF